MRLLRLYGSAVCCTSIFFCLALSRSSIYSLVFGWPQPHSHSISSTVSWIWNGVGTINLRHLELNVIAPHHSGSIIHLCICSYSYSYSYLPIYTREYLYINALHLVHILYLNHSRHFTKTNLSKNSILRPYNHNGM